MASVNRVTLIGNLGRDPEVRYSASGFAIVNLNLATTRRWKDRETNEWKDETEWHRVSLFGRLAEVAGEYLRKGSPVYIEGRLQTRKWQDKEGQDRYTTEIIGEIMQMLGGRDSSEGHEGGNQYQPAGGGSPTRQTPYPTGGNQYAQASGGTARPEHTQLYGNSDPNEDVPF